MDHTSAGAAWGIDRLGLVGRLGPSEHLPTLKVKDEKDNLYVLKCCRDSHRANVLGPALDWFFEHGVPASRIQPTVDGQYGAPLDGRWFTLSPWLPGRTVDQEAMRADSNSQSLLGTAAGILHKGAEGYRTGDQFSELQFAEELSGWIREELMFGKNSELVGLLESTTGELRPPLTTMHRGLIHRDLNPSNVLCSDGRLAGVIDFDMLMVGEQLFDLAYASSGMLADIEQDDRETWIHDHAEIVAAYHQLLPVSETHVQTLAWLLVGIELLFAAFWRREGNLTQHERAASLARWLYGSKERITAETMERLIET